MLSLTGVCYCREFEVNAVSPYSVGYTSVREPAVCNPPRYNIPRLSNDDGATSRLRKLSRFASTTARRYAACGNSFLNSHEITLIIAYQE